MARFYLFTSNFPLNCHEFVPYLHRYNYLYVRDSCLIRFQVFHSLLEAFPHQVATATGLQLGDKSLVGEPQLLSIVGSGYSRNHRLRSGNKNGFI